jgi:NAD-dependent deacetylase
MLQISAADRIFILTGSGVSAESGIPTFRGARGLWRNYGVEKVASPHAWARDPRLVWEFYSMRRRVATGAKPNAAHFALAKLQETVGEGLFLCTQNVDSLHERAGSRRVVHMHGELFKSRCDSCRRTPFVDDKTYEPPAEIPRCECGGHIRPHICWFGEVPFEMERIYQALDRCTVFAAIGTREPFVFRRMLYGKSGRVVAELIRNRLTIRRSCSVFRPKICASLALAGYDNVDNRDHLEAGTCS